MNSHNEIQELLNMFVDGNGFGDPDARHNAEQRLQVTIWLIAKIYTNPCGHPLLFNLHDYL